MSADGRIDPVKLELWIAKSRIDPNDPENEELMLRWKIYISNNQSPVLQQSWTWSQPVLSMSGVNFIQKKLSKKSEVKNIIQSSNPIFLSK